MIFPMLVHWWMWAVLVVTCRPSWRLASLISMSPATTCPLEVAAQTWQERPEWAEIAQAQRLTGHPGDFFADEKFPDADIITMGNILHDWDAPTKKMLLSKAFASLSPGGAFVCLEADIDNDRRDPARVDALMMSLLMLIETNGGYNWSENDFREMATEVGFTRFETIRLAGPNSALIAYKPM
eukprot:TRINITY_DN5379_c0_g1_i3.p1 TRINITY_DN5379_c0_g1~~TRINITY_DN5379_c0_g1_i3.p1  ORF type:complete len:183 (-),score=41.73 TRINITY_DN5379_c0_g1_i3:16-564(-)